MWKLRLRSVRPRAYIALHVHWALSPAGVVVHTKYIHKFIQQHLPSSADPVRIRPSPCSRALAIWRERLAGKHTGQFVLEVSAGGSGDPEDAVAGVT